MSGRNLPWRRTGDPYKIWVSEIMLQQTQVETVIPYYERFIRALPDVSALAEAEDDVLFKLWQGLGYYRRAAHLKEAAVTVMKDFGGHMPASYETLLQLKGIGPYSAAAIASIAYGQPKGVVDGNTLRIIARLFNLEDNIALDKTKKAFGQLMDALIGAAKSPSAFNQAMMDLGAMICTPRKPDCPACPLKDICRGRRADTVLLLPVNIKKVKRETEEMVTAVIRAEDRLMLVRNREGLLKDLYGFVQTPCSSPSAFEAWFLEKYKVPIRLQSYIGDVKHVFTHRTWLMHVYAGYLLSDRDQVRDLLYTDRELEALPVSTAHMKVLKAWQKAEKDPS